MWDVTVPGMTLRSGTRTLARAVSALVLALALLIPTIDICICAADLNLAAPGQTAMLEDEAAHDKESATGSPCRACHCFHAVGVMRLERVALGADASGTRQAWSPLDAVHAAPAFTLLRPPRA